VSGNSSYTNQGGGISTGPGVTMLGNAVYGNTYDGIETEFGEGSLVKENTVRYSTGFGLKLSADTADSDNVLTTNTGGTVSGGVNAGGNVCDGSLTCP
jgi:hypothetical protein